MTRADSIGDVAIESRREPTPDCPRGLVRHDAPCVACGYSLKGLDAAGRCPECGRSISLSIRSDLIELADRRWVMRVTRGLRLLEHGGWLWLVTGAVVSIMVLGLFVLIGVMMNSGWRTPWSVLFSVLAIGGLIGLGMILRGAWLTTTAEPAALSRWSRSAVRSAIPLVFIACLVAPLAIIAGGAGAGVNIITVDAALLYVGFSLVAMLLGTADLAASFCSRLPDARLARTLTRRARTCGATGIGAALVFAATNTILTPTVLPELAGWILIGVLTAATGVLWAMAIASLRACRRRMHALAAHAL